MSFAELLVRLQQLTGLPLLCGTAAETLAAARAGAHPNQYLGEVLRTVAGWCRADADARLDRAAVVNALGPLRRRAMAEDGSVAEFRALNAFIEGVDAAFDAAADVDTSEAPRRLH